MTIGIPQEREGDLTVRFRNATKKIHSLSNSLVSARLVFLFTDRTLYGRALSCFYLVHKQLDESLRVAIETGDAGETSVDRCFLSSDPSTIHHDVSGIIHFMYTTDIKAFGPLMAEAARTASFETDLEFFLGPDWENQVVRTPEVQTYVDHLVHLQETDPLALLSHAYTQHMSLLAGGKLLKKGLQRSLRLDPDGPGVAVYTFPPRDRTGRGLRGDYKDAINHLGRELDPARQQVLVDECTKAFELNNGILKGFPMGVERPLLGTLRLVATTWWVQAIVAAGVALGIWRYWRSSPAA